MNKLICGVALLSAAALVAAYEFDDPVYNQVLAHELQELNSGEFEDAEYTHPRSRRDEEAVSDKCRQRRKKFCCAEESFEANHDKDREMKRECFKEVTGKDKDSRDARGEFDPFRCDKAEKHKKEMTCVFQCVGQKKNVLDKDGNPIKEKFASLLKETMVKEAWFADLHETVVETCLAEAKNATESRDASDTEACNPAGVKLGHCLFREIQLACPTDQIKDEKACSRARDKIKKHNYFFSQQQFMNDE